MASVVIEYLMNHPEFVENLPKEMLEQLMELVRMEKAKLRAGSSWLPPSALEDMVKAVPDTLVRDLVNDGRRSNEPGFLKPEGGKGVERGTGWTPLDPVGPPPGIRYVDEMCEAQDAVDRAERMKGFGLAGLGGPRVLTKDEG